MRTQRHEKIPEEELAECWFAAKHQAFERLLECFRVSGIKQKDLADRLGIDESRVSRLLKGRSNMTLRVMCNLARAMNHRLEIDFKDLQSIAKSNIFFNAHEIEAKSKWVSGGVDQIPTFIGAQTSTMGNDETVATRRF